MVFSFLFHWLRTYHVTSNEVRTNVIFLTKFVALWDKLLSVSGYRKHNEGQAKLPDYKIIVWDKIDEYIAICY